MSDGPFSFKIWRLGLGLSQPAAATVLGLSTRAVRFYEAGARVKRPVELACRYIEEHQELIAVFGLPRRQIIPNKIETPVDIDIPESP